MVHFLAPLVLVVAVFMGFAVLPMGRNMVLVDMDAGLLFFFAMGASTELSVFMAGWSSRNKYSLLGAMRAVAQMISYEVPLLLSSVAVVMITGSLSLVEDCRGAEPATRGILPHWYVFTPWGFAGFLMFAIAARRRPIARPSICRKASRSWWPATTPSTRASNLRCSSWANTWRCFPSPAWAPRCFWADGRRRSRFCTWVPSWIWFFGKVMVSIFVFIWMRGTLPRLRQDQLMNFAWKFVLPMTLLNLVVAALWRFMGEGWLRWVVCSVILRGCLRGDGPRGHAQGALRSQEIPLC